ncbi:MAG TPA: biopolymer transporter ExbB [Bacteroidetes bacterium]|nr:biopolymer transporter ExbB [Bacteroidota bacterium]
MSLLLQINMSADSLSDTTAAIASTLTPAGQTQEPLSFLTLIMKGGWIMIPIGILSVLALYFSIERFLTIRKASRVDSNFMNIIKDFLISGKMEAAIAHCKNTNTPIARLLLKGIKRVGKPIKEIESAVENEGKLEIYRLEKNMNWLGIIAGIAPMMGFVGTIMGVITIFYDISISKNISIDVIASGLYVKMITSAAGLIVGIFAHIMFHLLNSMIDRVSYQIESNAVDFIDLIQEPTA